MKIYTHSKYSYVRVVEIPKDEIKKIDFALCKQPTETLSAFYNRQAEKPDIVCNCGFFGMSDGSTCFNYVSEYKAVHETKLYQWGMGITGDTNLEYGKLKGKQWRDFVSGYPNLIDNGQKVKIDFATELNYKARRTMLGYSNDTIFLVFVESPGLAFTAMQDLMLGLGCQYAINCDGGGSTKALHKGESITKDATNRAVDNVIAVYLKPVATKEETQPDANIKLGSTEILEAYLTKNECYQREQKMVPKGIVVHSTGANNPWLKRYVDLPDELGKNLYGNHWNQYRPGGKQKCVHAFIGKDKNGQIKICHTLPYNYCAWGVGSGSKGSYNFNPAYIQFEICEDGLKDEKYFTEVFDAAAEYCAYLCKEFKLPIENIVSHYEAHLKGYGVGHKDCDHWLAKFGKTMNDFRNDVIKKMGGTVPTPATPKKNIDVTYQAYSKNKWWGKITNYNNTNTNGYSGIEKSPIQALKISLSEGSVQYRAHTKNGKWWSWITDSVGTGTNSYSGVLGQDIDAIQIKLIGDIAKTHNIKYRVSTVDSTGYLDWINGASGTDSTSYAGIMGKSIDKIQMYVEEK